MSVFSEIRELMVKHGNPTRGTRIRYTDPDTGEFVKTVLGGVCDDLSPETILRTGDNKGMTGRVGVKVDMVLTDDDIEFGPGNPGTRLVLTKILGITGGEKTE